MTDSYSKFSRVVQDYVRYRPRYPRQLITLLENNCQLTSDSIIADIGSGTGLLAERFLENGNLVYGVEPNPDMQEAAEVYLKEYPQFKRVDATALATTLPSQSVDVITAGQAFHYFHDMPTRQEFLRILKPTGWLVLVWNLPSNHGTAFGNAFEQIWRRYISAEEQFRNRQRPSYIDEFYGENPITVSLRNVQNCDLQKLKGRFFSASRAPAPESPQHASMLADLETLFDDQQVDGIVKIEYDLQVILGQLKT